MARANIVEHKQTNAVGEVAPARIAFTHQPTPLVDDWQKTDVSLVEIA